MLAGSRTKQPDPGGRPRQPAYVGVPGFHLPAPDSPSNLTAMVRSGRDVVAQAHHGETELSRRGLVWCGEILSLRGAGPTGLQRHQHRPCVRLHADPDTGLPGGRVHHVSWIWDQERSVSELERPEPRVLFVCGSSRNRDRFPAYFTKVFNLRIDDDTMRRRLEARTDDDWPLGQEAVELILQLNRSGERPATRWSRRATRSLTAYPPGWDYPTARRAAYKSRSTHIWVA
jgi:hypothetical protein